MKNKKEESAFVRDRRQELETIKRLHGFKRLEHIWIYYKARIFVTCFTVFVIFTFANMLWEGQKPCRLRVCAVLESGASCEEWFENFYNGLKEDGKKGEVLLDEDFLFDSDNSYIQLMEVELMSMVSSQRLDAAICGKDMYEYLLSINACMDLDELFGGEMPQNTVFAKGEAAQGGNEKGVIGNYAVDISDTAFAKKYGQGAGGPLYAIVISNTEHTDDAKKLLEELAGG